MGRRIHKKEVSPDGLANRVVRILRRREELKLIDIGVSVALSSTPTVYPLTQSIVQGITAVTRIGNIVRLQSLRMSFLQHINSSGSFASTRIIVFRDKENRGAIPAYTDVVTNGGVSALYGSSVVQEKRIIILYDKTFGLNINGDAMHAFKSNIKLDFDCFYNGTTGTATDNGKNSLWLMAWSSDNVNKPGLDGDIEVTWTDS